MTEEKQEEIEKIQEMSLSYRIYLLSRRDFQSGVLIGITSSITLSYVTQLDLVLNNGVLSPIALLIRIIITAGVLAYFVYNHRKRTKGYETLLKKMSERMQKINQEIDTKQ